MIGSRIRRFIDRELIEGTPPPGDPLSLGLLDSVAVEQLVAFLEERFEVVFAEGDVTAETFSSIPAVVDLVRRKRRSGR